ncbi:unnamed protein product [Rotaria socialis]|uniref:VWFC domain-containing protein n=3 Tax=Rotaria socialis TaxID=392032 RepID=A0A818JLV1_9BILA|nr:unnamed protein product [Rotaria socialis]CAF3541658.1 unnamed protein product [Rotaria socialis]CAF3647246.1 unnamed protein product [Rotaria socialis]CAF4175809.1 unnamed protein product [Rotaria socialis]CAF4395354.1 unnamed protein product [Rotaria socialis]
MIGLSNSIVFLVIIFSVASQGDVDLGFITTDYDKFIGMLCHSHLGAQSGICRNTSASTPHPPGATTPATTQATQGISGSGSHLGSSSSSISPLASAHWCHLTNGTNLPLGYLFMYAPCTICQCTSSHNVLCSKLACMNTYCKDDSTPAVRYGQCCPQCAYEANATACYVSGVGFPHGALLKSTTDNVNCWCEYGNIECRQATTSVFAGLDLWGNGTAPYVIATIILIILFVGLLLCCSCTLLYYYYYQRNQHVIQQVYDQYCNNTGGWQPMNEDGVVVDANAEQKQAEAENSQFKNEYPTGNSEAFVPPPYALYNGAYVNDGSANNQKHA